MTTQPKVGRMCPHDNKLPDGTCPLCTPKAEEIASSIVRAKHAKWVLCDDIKVINSFDWSMLVNEIAIALESYANTVSEQRVSSSQSEVAALLELCSQYKDSGKADTTKWMQLEKDLKEVKQNRDYYQGVVYKKAVIENIRNEALDEASNCLLDEAILGRDHSWLMRCEYANKIRSLKREPR